MPPVLAGEFASSTKHRTRLKAVKKYRATYIIRNTCEYFMVLIECVLLPDYRLERINESKN